MPRTPTRRKKIETERQIESKLENIYQDSSGDIPNMKQIERRGSHTGFVIATFGLFFMAAAAGAAWLGFFLFSPSQKFSEANIVIGFVPPTQIVNGVEQDYSLTLTNNGSLALANTKASLKLPENFVIVHSKPNAINDRGDSWKLGALDGGENKTVAITAVYAAPKETRTTVRAYIDYRPSNFNSDFEKVVDTNLVVATDSIELSSDKKILTDGKHEISVKYKNISDQKIAGGSIRVSVGAGFKLVKSTPTAKPVSTSLVFEVPELAAGQSGTVTLSGSFNQSANPPESIEVAFERTFGATTLVLARAGLANDKIDQPAATTKPLTIAANGAEEISVKTGDAVKMTVTYKNNSAKTIKNIVLVMTGDTPSVKGKSAFDFTKLETVGDPDVVGKQISPEIREAKVTWHPEKIPTLRELAPGQSVTIEATITLKQIEEILKQASATFVASLSADGDVLQLSDPVIVKILQ
ncbi:MAG: hypothetical protein A2848_00950 [Candidatus Magasanikbacteria bacterium RIFCSPHIGHO2_01_FULL_50_8]|uniref:DUF11 domain-containing protein n=2 Tax=Candidatus Magasanikiibacteriota TaxID=1752731 RepID=A0A1F6LUC8_9BACT|nr:MAG: hypothetical protein A2848_00950 [Candidatus Magasanikbacteria bacterium RIFCSPHIGHO2_01_FULL_50_8]OGH68192.1 MAG: hypothetical protein A3C15_01060 [Candidatus Magasanikbacteria bacterium RIFCSPHIGHO2_02_FULL_50_9b]